MWVVRVLYGLLYSSLYKHGLPFSKHTQISKNQKAYILLKVAGDKLPYMYMYYVHVIHTCMA